MPEALQSILPQFFPEGVLSCSRYGCGHINETYLVTARNGKRYILQKVSTLAFPDVKGLQENITAVTAHLRGKNPDPRGTLHLVPTVTGESWYALRPDSNWRVFDYIEDSICLEAPRCPEDFYESALAFGGFQQALSDFPAETLHETIRDFHNTPARFRQFKEAVARDPLGRAAETRQEIDFALAHEQVGSALVDQLAQGILPLRVTHNDTKLNNVMLDAKTHEPLCVIDLDTTMPGLSAYDFGDSIRFGAATAPEDEQDLSKVEMDLDLYRIFTRGFLKACPALTEAERASLPLGALVMTLECGIRFLADHIDGDRYFGIHREGQNLDRARTQFKLVADMEKKWEEMKKIVEEEYSNMQKPVLVVMAAGMGSRYGGLKQIDPVGSKGEAILDYSLFDAHEAGFDTAVIIIKEAIKKDFMETVGARLEKAPLEIRYAYQELDKLPAGYTVPEGRTKPWGTCHAVVCAREAIGDAPFAVINADDYYGKDAFATMAKSLKEMQGKTNVASMVAYRLKNTVSENGHVTRGVCARDDKNHLVKVQETYKIKPFPDGTIRDVNFREEGDILDPEALVSMNFWGLTPWFFGAAARDFAAFLRADNGDPMKKEFVLPTEIDALMHSDGLTVDVLSTDAVWFGVTYREDKPYVMGELKKLHDAGQYPESL